MRVLLVEDDSMIGEAIQSALKDNAYAVDWVQDGRTALHTLSCQHYDLVLLDLGLPGQDGLDLLLSIRAHQHLIPLIIITARDALDDRLCGLDRGADDYLLKPFAIAELLARIRAVLRRKSGSAISLLENDILSLDLTSYQVKVDKGEAIALSNREFGLLQALMLRPGTILSRSELEDRLYGWGEEVDSNAIEFLIHSLRKKIGRHNIKNVRGLGWMVSKGS